ncbi:MAG TPA: lipid-binding SYLF domain-containing protein [Myxococcota bacterium]|nr:lipid-binding SYLF domain-containing protein [Myxococcota bacterium]
MRPGFPLVLLVTALIVAGSLPARAASKREIETKSTAALKALLDSTPAAKTLAEDAKAILIFPEIVKGGFIVGGQVGSGMLQEHGKAAGYYRSFAGSYGLQAGVQSFGYVLMFMDDESRAYLDKSKGWEIGVGPSIVLVDEGVGKNLTTTTLKKGVYAFIFDQKGLMAGIGIQGSKITKIDPKD